MSRRWRGGPSVSPVSLRELNRWTLARQLLLERADLDAVTAIEKLGGLQAQLPLSPYIALWSRLRGFRSEELEAALLDRRVVKSNLMRVTLHLVAAREFHLYRRAVEPVSRQNWREALAAAGDQLEPIRAELLRLAGEGPVSRARGLRVIQSLAPGMAELERFRLWNLLKIQHLVADPARALFRHAPSGDHILAPEVAELEPSVAAAHLVRVHLSAFGPATRADTADWSGQTVARLLAGFDLLGPELVEFEGPDGEWLHDLRDAPRPSPEIEAPVRYLPRWDSLLLGHKRRQRVISDALRKVVIHKNGDVMATFTVDGFVAGLWRLTEDRGTASLTLTPLTAIAKADLGALQEEGERLLCFLAPGAGHRIKLES